MSRRLTLGFSSCPNDTFIFHALVTGLVEVEGVTFDVVMEDVEALNRRALGCDPLAVTKLSVGTLGHASSRYAVLSAGAALGRGCGPLVVRRDDRDDIGRLSDLRGLSVAVPGKQTTAYLLLRTFGPDVAATEMRFDAIMPAVTSGEFDAGLIIHESRFTYPDHGLTLVEDLGERWESVTGGPLPLGVIAIDRAHADLAAAVEAGIRRSVAAAWADPEASRPFIRAHAQELGDDVCRQHIALYVNEFSADLGSDGRAAIRTMLRRGEDRSLLPAPTEPLFAR
jgi:1,4-dihydroxy-6-naphthoate synthase